MAAGALLAEAVRGPDPTASPRAERCLGTALSNGRAVSGALQWPSALGVLGACCAGAVASVTGTEATSAWNHAAPQSLRPPSEEDVISSRISRAPIPVPHPRPSSPFPVFLTRPLQPPLTGSPETPPPADDSHMCRDRLVYIDPSLQFGCLLRPSRTARLIILAASPDAAFSSS